MPETIVPRSKSPSPCAGRARNPASLEVCALLARETISPMDRASLRYVGFSIPQDWVVGYGLDFAERYRNLPDLHLWDGPREPSGPSPTGRAE